MAKISDICILHKRSYTMVHIGKILLILFICFLQLVSSPPHHVRENNVKEKCGACNYTKISIGSRPDEFKYCCNCASNHILIEECPVGFPDMIKCISEEEQNCIEAKSEKFCENFMNAVYSADTCKLPLIKNRSTGRCICKEGFFTTTTVKEGCFPLGECIEGFQPMFTGNRSSNTRCELCPNGTHSNVTSRTEMCKNMPISKPSDDIKIVLSTEEFENLQSHIKKLENLAESTDVWIKILISVVVINAVIPIRIPILLFGKFVLQLCHIHQDTGANKRKTPMKSDGNVKVSDDSQLQENAEKGGSQHSNTNGIQEKTIENRTQNGLIQPAVQRKKSITKEAFRVFESKGFQVTYDPKMDGSCQFSVIAKCLGRETPEEIRREIVDEIEKNKERYKNFIDGDFEVYLSRMKQKDCFGDHITIQAASNLYDLSFKIIQTSTNTPIWITPWKSTYTLGHIAEDQGLHYVCLKERDSSLPSPQNKKIQEDETRKIAEDLDATRSDPSDEEPLLEKATTS